MKNILLLALATSLLASCSSSSSLSPLSVFPKIACDASLYEKSPVVLRVEIIPGYDHLRQHRKFPVHVIQTYKNTTDIDIPKTLEVASTAEWGGLPACGKCTVYLKPNPSNQKSAPALALDEPSGVYIQKHIPAYSHHAFPKEGLVPPTTASPQPDPAPTTAPAKPAATDNSLAESANKLAASKKPKA